MDKLFNFMRDEEEEILIRTALVHLEFEAIHPFKDGNAPHWANAYPAHVVEGGRDL